MASRINWAPLRAQQNLRAQQFQDSMYGAGRVIGKNWDGITGKVKEEYKKGKKKFGGLFSGLADNTTTGDVDGLDSDALVTTDLRGTKLDNFVNKNLTAAKDFLLPEGGAKYTDQEGLFRGGQKFNPNIGEDVDGDGKPDGGFEADNRLFGRVGDFVDTTADVVRHGPGYVMDELENKAKDIAGMPGKYIKGVRDQRDAAALADIQGDIDSWGDDIPTEGLDSTGRPIVPLSPDDSEIDIEPITGAENLSGDKKKGLMDFLFPQGGQKYKDMLNRPNSTNRNQIYKNGEIVGGSEYNKEKETDLVREESGFGNGGLYNFNNDGLGDNSDGLYDFSDQGSGTSENSAMIEAANNSPFAGDIDAIRQFQEENGLEVDGFWGPNTQAAWDNSQGQSDGFNSNYLNSSTEESLSNDYYNQQQWDEDNAPPGAHGFY